MTEDDLPPPPQNSGHSTLSAPTVTFPQAESNWPIKNLGESFFDRALANGSTEGFVGQEPSANGVANGGDQLDAWANEEIDDGGVGGAEGEDEDEGWDLDAEVIAPPEEEVGDAAGDIDAVEADLSEGVSAGVAENEMWVRNSPLAADHAAAGTFESAMQVSHYYDQPKRSTADSRFSYSTVKLPRSNSHPSNHSSYNVTNRHTFPSPPIPRYRLFSSMSVGIPKRPRCARSCLPSHLPTTTSRRLSWQRPTDSSRVVNSPSRSLLSEVSFRNSSSWSQRTSQRLLR